ncbi:hypothetical protein [Rhizobium sp. CIAT894]|uniref:hypothetical protein n=1 Tax=Rhizobium sp. CIAT894 TaxID=2020312 RepID=UPI000A1E5419|nr:hypothetical protein [Rhizobium sp. CIAT894]
MPSLFELCMAERVAALVDDHGNCNHLCVAHSPFGLGEYEAQKLRRYDPDAFAKLEAAGLVTHEVEVEDFESVGQRVGALTAIKNFNDSSSEDLYKHAIAVRLQRVLLIANGHSKSDEIEQISNVFGNEYQRYD